MFSEFIRFYGVFLMLLALGLLLIAVSFGAMKAGRSGVPLSGGLLILIGGLTTPKKWLALLCLLDYGIWMIIISMITDHIKGKRFGRFISEHGFSESVNDTSRVLKVTIPERDETLIWPYVTAKYHELRIPALLFSICYDSAGKRYMLCDKSAKGKNIEILPFDEDSFSFGAIKDGKQELTVSVSVESRENY